MRGYTFNIIVAQQQLFLILNHDLKWGGV